MSSNPIPSQDETRTRIAIRWLINHRNTMITCTKEKLTAAIDTILEEYGPMCGTCGSYNSKMPKTKKCCGNCRYWDRYADSSNGTCNFPLPIFVVDYAGSYSTHACDGDTCPCWKKIKQENK